MTRFRRASVVGFTGVVVLLGALCRPVLAQTGGCTSVTAELLAIPQLKIAGSNWQEADAALPRHCLVSGTMNERTGADGRSYAIQFEMRLPVTWNGRFLHQVNGGNDGQVVPALGDRPDALVSGGMTPLARGFAVLSSDSGHTGSDPVNKPLGLAAGAAFGLDPQARRDYGYAADMTLSPVAKTIIAAHYGRKPDYSYMAGCSNGGRHTMVAAERMPENYDGFLVGNPGFNLPRSAIQHAWDVQAFSKVDPDIRKSITRDDGRLISKKITEACDALDGLRDGLTANLKACQKAFNFDSLACPAGATEDCLPQSKIAALKASFAGPKNSKGDALYSDWPVDGGDGMGNWRSWKIESQVAPWNNYPIIATMGAASLAYIFSTPPVQIEGTNEKLIDALLKYDFDRDAPKIFAKDEKFSESAMDFMAPPSVDDPKMTELQKLSHKMIIYHGQADPVFSVNDTIRWYEALSRNTGGKADTSVRLFTVPGETHCGGGIALEKFDALSALVDWVEKGKAPDQIVATANPANKEIPTTWDPNRSRPLCPWPKYARYAGGNAEVATSFECVAQ